MRSKLLYIFVACFMLCLPLSAQKKQMNNADSISKAALADSINKAAQAEDFIHAYIDIASAGDKIYSCFGHSAIRLVCPSKNLDFCFTFEIDMDESNVWDFVTHKAKGGFAAAPAADFLKQYSAEGRGVKQYELTLRPHEKQNLWKLLDEEVGKGPYWTFDFYKVNCSSMVMWAVACALDSCQLSFPQVPECLNGNYHDAVAYMSTQSPWYGLAWQMIIIDGGPENSVVTDRMAPKMMAECLPYAMIVNEAGTSRPLLKGKPQQLFTTTYIDMPCAFHPWMAVVIFIVIVAAIITIVYKRNKRNKSNKQARQA